MCLFRDVLGGAGGASTGNVQPKSRNWILTLEGKDKLEAWYMAS